MGWGGNLDQVREGGTLASCTVRKHLSRDEHVRGERKPVSYRQKAQKGNAQEQELRSTDERRSLYSDNPGRFLNVGTCSCTEKVH